MRLYVHEVLFRESIWAQGTPEQWDKYKDDINTYKIIGCFAMTELGHSSHLPGTQLYSIMQMLMNVTIGLETTATYDKKTQEFIIHS